MLQLDKIGDNYLLISFNNLIFLYDLKSDNLVHSINHTNPITVVKYLPKRNFIIFCDNLKKLHFYDVAGKKNVTIKNVSKRPFKLIITKDETKMILADKTGDAYLFDLTSSEFESKLLMGHVSMMTDMILNNDEKFLFTADRDEKIRISHFPNSYNIEAFLLGHKDFVKQIELLSENKLLSSSGDETLRLWDVKSGSIDQKIDLTEYKDDKNKNSSAFRFVFNHNSGDLLVNLFQTNNLLYFVYDFDKNQFNYIKQFGLNKRILEFLHLSDNNYLFVVNDVDDCLCLKSLINNELQNVDSKNLKLNFQQRDDFKNTLNLDTEIKDFDKDFSSLFKSKVDNMNDYYERKEKRVKMGAANSSDSE